MAEHSPARLIIAWGMIAAMAAGAVWVLLDLRAEGGAAPPPATADATPAPTDSSSPSPPAPEPTAAPAGPATGDYAELATAAELEHPDTDPAVRVWYELFRPIEGSWTNRDELWNELVAGLREEAVELGPPFNAPLWNGDTPMPALVEVIWGDATTDGRGDVALAEARHRRDGRVVTRVWAFLVASDSAGRGRIFAQQEPFDLYVTDHRTFDDYQTARNERIWPWIWEQEPVE